jgi:hypothetical protein
MGALFKTVVEQYQDKINLMPSIPKRSFERSLVGRDGVPTRLFRVFI